MLFKIVSRIVSNVMQAGNWLPDFKTSRFKLDQRFNWHCSLIVCTAGSISRSRVRPSARPSVSSLTEAAACGGFAAERRATAARRSAANASSVTLTADAGSWIDLFFCILKIDDDDSYVEEEDEDYYPPHTCDPCTCNIAPPAAEASH